MFMNGEKRNEVLTGLKIFLKTCAATSPEMEMLKQDLVMVIDAIYSGDSVTFVNCNRYITMKYPMSETEVLKNNLCYMNDVKLMSLGKEYQIMSLYQLACLLEAALKRETFKTKMSALGFELVNEAVVYGIRTLLT